VPEFRKKPVVIEAVQFVKSKDPCGTNLREIIDFIGGNDGDRFLVRPPRSIGIVTLEGTMWATLGDYVIRGVQGEFYPCKPDIFEATYEAVDAAQKGEADA
jgi:small ligand-binding sensory domain FIST